MPSTYSTIGRLEMVAAGEKAGSWNTVNNLNIGTLLAQMIAGVASITHDNSADYTATALNGAADEARCMVLDVSGTLTAARNLIVPDHTQIHLVANNTTGGFAFTVKTASGTGISIPNGYSRLVRSDGTNVVNVISDLPTGTTINGTAISVSGHTHTVSDVTDAGALAALDTVSATEIDSDAVTTVKILNANVTTAKIATSNITTALIADDNVTYAKIQNVVSDQVVLGNIAGAGGPVAELTAAQLRTLINVENGATADQSAADIRALGFFDTSNDGTGSGLDADTLDGSEGSAFLKESFVIPVTSETGTVAAGTGAVTFRAPYALTVNGVRASLTTASSSGAVTIDINEGGISILSTKLTIDESEKTSTTAATPAVISDSSIASDAEITIDVDNEGTDAAGLKVTLICAQVP